MVNKKLTLSAVASLLLATNLFSEDLSSILITSSSIETTELDATYSTEVYTKEDIEKSKSKDIYDFLNSQTSVTVTPNVGNTFSQQIDLRGYGITDGYENIVVTVNGRRLNNIDQVSQLLSSIPVESVKKIEIIKGSGSVQYGDGANAGVINIVTNGQNENYIKSYIGKDGLENTALSLGYSNESIILNAYTDYSAFDGSREDSSGDRTSNYNKNKYINLTYFPTNNLELRLGRSFSNMSIKYGGPVASLEEYKSNPSLAPYITEQYFSSYVTTAGVTYDFSPKYSIDLNYSSEDKLSNYIAYSSKRYYEYESYDAKLNIKDDKYKVVVGVDAFDGSMTATTDTIKKENRAIFISSNYYLNKDTTVSLGGRKENVKYDLSEVGESNKDIDLYAFDLGINYKLNENSSIFANFNKSYQAPDIDRFFWYGSFVSYLEPAKVKTFNIGYSNIQSNNKFKASIFRSDLKNEIFYYPTGAYTGVNSNIDKSHKYGLELYDKYIINKNFSTSVNYSYIIAKIDEDDAGSGTYNGKYLPGVSKHNVTVNLSYTYDKFNTILSHTYRSSAYASEDFANNLTEKQEAYNSTDLSVSYTFKNIELFGKVQNLFDEDNGLWINDTSIYPVDFERTYYAGIKYKF